MRSKSKYNWAYGHHGIIAREAGITSEQLTSILKTGKTNPETAEKIKVAAKKYGYTIEYNPIRTVVEIKVL